MRKTIIKTEVKMKNCLTRNKIYFETIAASFLALMSVIISINTICLTKRQLALDKLKEQPNFVFKKESKDWYLINNNNKPANNIDIEIKELAAIRFEYIKNYKVIYIPIIKMKAESEVWLFNGFKTSRVASIQVLDNENDIIFIKREVQNWEHEFKDINIKDIFSNKVIRISYTDVFGEENIKYFLYDGYFQPSIISNEFGTEVFNAFNVFKNKTNDILPYGKIQMLNLYGAMVRGDKYFYKR